MLLMGSALRRRTACAGGLYGTTQVRNAIVLALDQTSNFYIAEDSHPGNHAIAFQQEDDHLVTGLVEGAITHADCHFDTPNVESFAGLCRLLISHSIIVNLPALRNIMLSELLSASSAPTSGKREEAKAALVTIP